MASKWYLPAIARFLSGDEDWVASTYKVMLLDATYVFSASHEFVSSVNTKEISGAGYADGFGGGGRKTLTTKSVSIDVGANRVELHADPLTWAGLNAGTPGFAIVIREVTSDADSVVICCLDQNDLVTNGGDYEITWPAAGVATAALA